MVKLFDVDFSDSHYLEHQENYDAENTNMRERIVQQLRALHDMSLDVQEQSQLKLTDERYPGYDFDEHFRLLELNNHDMITFDMVREQINRERMQVIQTELDEGLHQNKELLAFGINRDLYDADFAMQSVAIFQDVVFEFDSLEDLLRACKVSSEYSFPLDFAVNQRMPFLFCPRCGKVKEYYQDPLNKIKQPYDLCWECEQNYNAIIPQ